jgi:hypothetical protein
VRVATFYGLPRVAIRLNRWSFFESCFPFKYARKTRRRLKEMISAAGEVRNADIAAELISRLTPSGSASLLDRVKDERKQAERALTGLLKLRTDSKWRSKLLAGSPDANYIVCRCAIEDTSLRTTRASVSIPASIERIRASACSRVRLTAPRNHGSIQEPI